MSIFEGLVPTQNDLEELKQTGLCDSCKEGKCEDCCGDFWCEGLQEFLPCQCSHRS